MSVSVLTEVTVVVLLEELLDLTGETDSHRIVLIDLSQHGIEYRVVLVRGVGGADAELLGREEKVVVILVCKGLSVSCALGGVIPYAVNVLLGGVGADGDIIAVCILLYHLGDEACGTDEHGIYYLTQQLLVTRICVVVPE